MRQGTGPGGLWAEVLSLGLAATLALAPGPASAQDAAPPGDRGFIDLREPMAKKASSRTRIKARVSASVGRITEDQAMPIRTDPISGMLVEVPEARTASDNTIQWLDLRGWFQTSKVRGPGLASQGDLRMRLAGDVRRVIDAAMRPTVNNPGQVPGATSYGRGQRGGSELDLRQLYGGWAGLRTSFYLGRMLVQEADALTIDGLRILRKIGTGNTELSLYGGLAPDPLSRSFSTDYPGDSLASAAPIAAGSTVAYRTVRTYGSVGAGAVLPRGDNDGDVVNPTTGARGAPTNEAPRIFVTSTGFHRLKPQWDLYHYAVLDVTSDAGFGVRALHGQVSYRPSLSFHTELGYSHLSTIALEVYLKDLLNDPVPNTVQSNLLVQRVARDEVRGQLDLTLGQGRYDLYAVGRMRRRSPVQTSQDPSFAAVSAQTAADITLGLRDRRSFKKLRLGTSATRIFDYRSSTTVLRVDVGRDFMKRDALSVETSIDYQKVQDDGPADVTALCTSRAFTACFGRYSGAIYDFGVTSVYRPDLRWLALFDLHVIYDNGASASEVRTPTTAQTPILSYIAFLKGQYSF